MTIMIGLGLACLIGGLLVLYLRSGIGNPVLEGIVWYVGIILVIFGIILLATPIMDWVYVQVRQMING